MAAYRSPEDSGFELLTTFSSRARMGELVADLYAGPTSRFDHGNSVYLDLLTGTLESVTDLRLFGGENALAVAQPGGAWEILQFGAAELLAPGRYRLSRLLRGQRGTEADMAPMVPEGARVVVLDAVLAPLPVNEADLGLPWNWRIGPLAKPVSDDSYTALPFTPRGVGLRPFSAVHVEQPWRRSRVSGLAGASVDSTIAIPNRAIVLGVSARTVTAVLGASSYDCGITGEPSKFGGSLGVAAGSSNIGVIGPTAFYADTPIRLTANGGSFTGGAVRIAIHYLTCGAPA